MVYAPFGNDFAAARRHDHQHLHLDRSGSYFEYWDVNPEVQAVKQVPRGYQSPVWNPSTKTLSVAQLPDDIDTQPLTIFASALGAPGERVRHRHELVLRLRHAGGAGGGRRGKLSDSIAPPDPNGTEGQCDVRVPEPVQAGAGRRA